MLVSIQAKLDRLPPGQRKTKQAVFDAMKEKNDWKGIRNLEVGINKQLERGENAS